MQSDVSSVITFVTIDTCSKLLSRSRGYEKNRTTHLV